MSQNMFLNLLDIIKAVDKKFNDQISTIIDLNTKLANDILNNATQIEKLKKKIELSEEISNKKIKFSEEIINKRIQALEEMLQKIVNKNNGKIVNINESSIKNNNLGNAKKTSLKLNNKSIDVRNIRNLKKNTRKNFSNIN